MNILNIAEKPSVAKSITQILANTYTVVSTKYKYTPVYKFQYKSVTHFFTSVLGHVYTQEFSEKKKWTDCDPITLFTADISEYIKDDMRMLRDNLLNYSSIADKVVVWTDCDREGEYIALEIQRLLNRKCWRARFSAITRDQIEEAISHFYEIDMKQCDCVAVRMELDLRIGASFTRLQTLNLSTEKKIISYGSCQIPTLGFVVDRALQHMNFVSEPFFSLKVFIVKNGIKNIFLWKRGNVFDKNCVLNFFMEVTAAQKCAYIAKIEKRSVNKQRPLPLRTVDMQKALSRTMSSHKIMQIAESLYTRGIISYPRTETDCFPKQFNYNNIKNKLMERYSHLTEKITFKGPRYGKNNDHAHLPIFPLKNADNLAVDEKKVFDFIANRFMAAISEDATVEEQTVYLLINDELFILKGSIVLNQGFLQFYGNDGKYNKRISHFAENEKFELVKINHIIRTNENDDVCGLQTDKRLLDDNIIIKEENQTKKTDEELTQNCIFVNQSFTSAPNYLTEAELIGLMDKHGIGTDATIHEHIRKIINRSYVFKRFRYFIPTSCGFNLINCYKTLGLDLDKPYYRCSLERNLKDIEVGIADKSDVLSKELRCYKEFYMILQNNLDTLKSVFNRTDDDNNTSTCMSGQAGGAKNNNRNSDDATTHEFINHDVMRNPTGIHVNNHLSVNCRHRAKKNNIEISGIKNKYKKTLSKQTKPNSKKEQLREITNDILILKNKKIKQNAVCANPSTSDNSNILCDCHEKAKVNIVKKGKNKGKSFYSCAKFPDGCNYFQWQGLVKLKDEFGPSELKCFCGINVRKFVSNTDKTRGKIFFKCNKRYKACDFFMWEEELKQ